MSGSESINERVRDRDELIDEEFPPATKSETSRFERIEKRDEDVTGRGEEM